MSFCSNVKAELCRVPMNKHCCAVAEAYGVLLFCNTFSAAGVRIVTESKDFAQRLPRLFKKAFDVDFDQTPETELGKQVFVIEDREKTLRIYETFGLEPETIISLHVNLGILEEECCKISFLRGAFMAGGSVTDPEKRYHLELATSQTVLKRVEQLVENYRIFFQSIGNMIEENNDRIAKLEDIRMPLGQIGVYCSKPAFQIMATDYMNSADNTLPTETKTAIFERLFKILADDFENEGKAETALPHH
jgi:DNA-binding protein WhiA